MRLPSLGTSSAAREVTAADRCARVEPSDTSTANRLITARNEFANAFGDLAKGKRNWQLMAFALTGLLAMVTLAYVRLAAASRVVPYVVAVDRLGQVVAVGTAEEFKSPDERLVTSQLAHFVRSIRTVLPGAASAAQAELVRRGYAFVAPDAAGFLNEYFASPRNDPRVLGTRLTRQIDVASVLRVPNSDVWRLQWTETERPTQVGGPVRTTAWEGYVTVKMIPPATAETIQDNPLGLYVTSVSWTQVSEGAPSPEAAHVEPGNPDLRPDSGATP